MLSLSLSQSWWTEARLLIPLFFSSCTRNVTLINNYLVWLLSFLQSIWGRKREMSFVLKDKIHGVHFPGWQTSSWKGCLSFMPDWSHHQKVKVCAPFPIALSAPLSLKKVHSCFPASKFQAIASTGAARWQCAPLGEGWNLFTHIVAHSGIGIEQLLLLYLPFCPPVPMMASLQSSLPHLFPPFLPELEFLSLLNKLTCTHSFVFLFCV